MKQLDTDERAFLLEVARQEIYRHFHITAAIQGPMSEPQGLRSIYAGAFVSLYIDGQLRGCIGTFNEDEQITAVIRKMALNAATRDYRFEPIGHAELDMLGIELSVLTPRKRIFDIGEVKIGRDGIYIVSGQNRGTLLPQVAVENNWDTETFVQQCSLYKAGIGPDGWKSAELYTYEAIVFRDFIKKNEGLQ